MSSGWNGIGIKNVGRTRYRLAEMLCRLTGVMVEAADIQRTNPYHRCYEDCCAWEARGMRPAQDERPPMQVSIYSWDTMTRCVKKGIEQVTDDHKSTGGISPWKIEVSAKS